LNFVFNFIKIERLYHIAAIGTIEKLENNMKQITASVFFDIISYTIGNNIFCIFKNSELNFIIITARVYKLRLAEVNFLCCFICFMFRK